MNTTAGKKLALYFIAGTAVLLSGYCRVDPYPVEPDAGYPNDVGQIFLGKCATSGCHSGGSHHVAAGLNLSSWMHLFEGSHMNASVVPYRPDQSPLFFSVNTFPDLGPIKGPTMPAGHTPLTRAEVLQVRDWIAAGAPDRNGNVAFSNNPERSKIYVANQGCDFITVFDAETKLIMRCIDVGMSSLNEVPHDMHVSPDGRHWYVTFFASSVLQKYSTVDDKLVAQLDLGSGGWHSMSVSSDSRYAALSKWDANGTVMYVDLEQMTIRAMWTGFSYPHGNAFHPGGQFLYVVSQQGNFTYKLDITDPVNPQVELLPLQPGDVPANGGVHKPYAISFSPDHEKYFITCQGTNELRVFAAANDSLLAIIPSSGVPQLIAFSEETDYAFITCMLDTSNENTVSSVDIINWSANTFVKTVYPGFEERGLAVDDRNKVVYIGNRNIAPGGPAPHHTTSCRGRNGDVSLISLENLEVVPGWRTEVGVDPYCLTIRK